MPDKYTMLNPDRVNFCDEGRPAAVTTHRRLVALITPLWDVHQTTWHPRDTSLCRRLTPRHGGVLDEGPAERGLKAPNDTKPSPAAETR